MTNIARLKLQRSTNRVCCEFLVYTTKPQCRTIVFLAGNAFKSYVMDIQQVWLFPPPPLCFSIQGGFTRWVNVKAAHGIPGCCCAFPASLVGTSLECPTTLLRLLLRLFGLLVPA